MGYLQSVVILCCISAVAALGLAILTGYTGLYSLGHAGFMAVGAYCAAWLVMRLHIPFALALLAGSVAAALLSLVIGYPALRSRLRGDYFAVVTLGFGEVVRLLLNNTPALGGAIGLPDVPVRTSGWLALAAVVLAFGLAQAFTRSQWGRNCIACRLDPLTARTLGVDVLRTQLTALAVSAFYAGAAGALLAGYMGYLSPAMFTLARSSELLAAVILGGVQSLAGPLLAALLLTAVPELLRFAASWRLVLYGALLVVTMLWRPQGLLGYYELPALNLPSLWRRMRGKGELP
ncbi:MAG: branched-chain amino acid ABC transporter permease [Chloroflexi bacterium]|nr:branched-chain amino acid ABC transporter permease [Chloroflexota bacterium]